MRRFWRTRSTCSGAQLARVGSPATRCSSWTLRARASASNPLRQASDDRRKGDRPDLERERSGVDARELEEVVDEQPQPPRLVAERPEVLLRLRKTVVDRLEHRGDGRHGGAEVVARRGDELASGVEEALEARRHLVEGPPQLRELARAGVGRTCPEVTRGDVRRGGTQPLDPAGDRPSQHERRSDGRRGGGGGDRQDLHVVAHVEHHPAREQDDEQRQADREECEAGQLEPHGRQEPQPEGRSEADDERDARDEKREADHGTNL